MSRDAFLPGEALVCAVSVTPRPDAERNEDAVASVRAPRFGLCGVAVADGLGSYSQAGPAARHVVREAAAWLHGQVEDFGRGTLARLFAHAHASLRSHAREAAGGADPEPQAFGTTLLVGLDAGAELVAAYAGNGAIWHMRGNLEANPSTGVAWNAVNLLNPHTVFREGREVLYNLLDAAQEHPPVPTVVTVHKDPGFGDILLVCTDGIYSADQVTHGLDANGAVWISAEATMVAFHRALREMFAAWDGKAELPLRGVLRAYLDDLRARGVLEDDATVGLIVTEDALRYQRDARSARGGDGPLPEPKPAGPGVQDGGTASPGGYAGEAHGGATEAEEDAGCPASPASAA
jgi:serine/threonine protein phosphatase PrpC